MKAIVDDLLRCKFRLAQKLHRNFRYLSHDDSSDTGSKFLCYSWQVLTKAGVSWSGSLDKHITCYCNTGKHYYPSSDCLLRLGTSAELELPKNSPLFKRAPTICGNLLLWSVAISSSHSTSVFSTLTFCIFFSLPEKVLKLLGVEDSEKCSTKAPEKPHA